jgi:hypothetical protein
MKFYSKKLANSPFSNQVARVRAGLTNDQPYEVQLGINGNTDKA